VLAPLLIASTAEANHRDRATEHWGTLRIQGIGAVPFGDNKAEIWNSCDGILFGALDFTAAVDLQTAGGAVGSFEYVIKQHYGLQLSFLYAANIVEISFHSEDLDIVGRPNFIMPLLGFNYHFRARRDFELYVGPVLGLGVLATGTPLDKVEISKGVALGLQVGADWFLNPHWSLGAFVDYLDFGEVDFSVLPPGIDGFICDNGVVGLGAMNFLCFGLGVGYEF